MKSISIYLLSALILLMCLHLSPIHFPVLGYLATSTTYHALLRWLRHAFRTVIFGVGVYYFCMYAYLAPHPFVWFIHATYGREKPNSKPDHCAICYCPR